MLTPYEHYFGKNLLLDVGVDDVQILLPGSNKTAIGTHGLNGCTSVVILGTTAMVMAHISPLPGSSADWERVSEEACRRASHDHHQRYLQIMVDLVRQNRQHFPTSTTIWGILSFDEEHEVLLSVTDQIQTDLNILGFGKENTFYKEIDPKDVKPPKGELVGVRSSKGLALYLEGLQLLPKQEEASPTVSHDSGPSSPSLRPRIQGRAGGSIDTRNSYWVWSGAQDRWAFFIPSEGQLPPSEWPMVQGMMRVFCTDENKYKWYDWGTRAWIGE